MKVTVIYPRANDPEYDFYSPESREDRRFEYEASAETVEKALNETWRAFNAVDGSDIEMTGKLGIRSSMVGDVYVIEGVNYVVAMCGFRIFTDEELQHWLENVAAPRRSVCAEDYGRMA